MTKNEAVRDFVARELSGVPTEWVRIAAKEDDEYPSLPMWGTMFLVDGFLGESILKRTRRMAYGVEDLAGDDFDSAEWTKIQKAIKEEDWDVLSEYVDEEMAGELCVLDKDGYTTGIYLYEVGGEYAIGIHGAGFNFYDRVWPSLYDTLGLQWHDQEA